MRTVHHRRFLILGPFEYFDHSGTEMAELRKRYRSLTSREQEVLGLVVRGLVNKQIGAELGISEPMVKLHRGRLMQKMAAETLADLIRMAEKLREPKRR